MTPRYGRLLVVPAVLVAILAIWIAASLRSSSTGRDRPDATEGGGAPAPPLPGGLEEIRRLRHGDPAKAAERCRPLLGSGDAAEREAARKLYPEILNALYAKKVRDWKYAEAEKIFLELDADFPGTQEAGWVRVAWRDDRLRWARKASEDGDWRTAERLFAAILAGEPPASGWQYLDAYRDYLLRRRDGAVRAGEAAAAAMYLEEAAGVIADPSGSTPVHDILRREGRAESLMARARELAASKRPAAALTWMNVAREKIEQERVWEKHPDFVGLYERCALDVAAEMRAGRLRTAPRERIDEFYRAASGSADPARRLEAREGVLDARIEEGVARLKKGEYARAEESFKRALGPDVAHLWEAQLQNPAFDPWPEVPIAVQDAIREKTAGRDEAARRAELTQMIRAGEFVPTHARLRTAFEALPELYAAWGVQLLEQGNVAAAVERMRGVLRRGSAEAPGPARRCVESLQASLKRALETRDMGRIFDLAGFYVSEVGLPATGDPFRADFRSSLAAAAEGLRTESPIKLLFILSLVDQCFPGEPEGRAAREEVLVKGLDAVRNQPKQPATGEIHQPSGLEGISGVSVSNMTEYHILVLYEGPERFFVRLNPRRKGTVVMKDGTYRVGVIVAADHVAPYREESTYASETYWESYVITASGGPRDSSSLLDTGREAWGDFVLLRTPENVRVRVDPKMGLVSPAK
ncbi:MAG: hypothetical protein HYY18_11770 [Planctomycetes bacterium]|nr:hypothetical protein [Planctomycetota bacterium]